MPRDASSFCAQQERCTPRVCSECAILLICEGTRDDRHEPRAVCVAAAGPDQIPEVQSRLPAQTRAQTADARARLACHASDRPKVARKVAVEVDPYRVEPILGAIVSVLVDLFQHGLPRVVVGLFDLLHLGRGVAKSRFRSEKIRAELLWAEDKPATVRPGRGPSDLGGARERIVRPHAVCFYLVGGTVLRTLNAAHRPARRQHYEQRGQAECRR